MKIVFMGTPEFSIPILATLLDHGYDIVGVITAPDKRMGRGRKLGQSAVKKYALSQNLHILQPTNLKNAKFRKELQSLGADLQVVVAFRMLPARVFEMPPLGCVNLHASLLPQYRGAAPINRVVMNGETETGLTTFFIQQQIDTGNLIFQEKMEIGEHETAGELHDRMKIKGAALVLKTVQAIENGTAPNIPQVTSAVLKKAPKIFKEDCLINWNESVHQVYNHIRGLNPYPTAYTLADNKMLKIFKSNKEILSHDLAVGTLVTDGKKYAKIAAKDGFINILELQLEGRRKMEIEAFLRGGSLPERVGTTSNKK